MEDWASLEIAPWRGSGLHANDVLERLAGAARRDPSICTFGIRDGIVTLGKVHEERLTPHLLRFVKPRAEILRDFLQSVVSEHRIDCDIHFGVRFEDRGPEHRRVPLFCFHKIRYESNILLPDLDFAICDFYAGGQYHDARAFADKSPTAFFAGATSGGIVTMARVESGGHERIRAARFFADKPGITFEISSVVQCDSDETRAAVEALVPMAGHLRSWPDQFAHRYLLNIDGNGTSWSRTAVALASNSTMVKYASPYQLFYFHGLEPWVHYVPVRRDSDVVEMVADADRTAERDADIAQAGQRFAARHLNREAITAYTASLLRQYAAAIPTR